MARTHLRLHLVGVLRLVRRDGKGRLRDASERAPLAQRVLVGVLDGILRLVQPIMPFVAESIWQALNEAAFERGLPGPEPATESVVIAPWPEFPSDLAGPAHGAALRAHAGAGARVREVRNRYNVEPRTALDVSVRCSEAVAADFAQLERRSSACWPASAKLAMRPGRRPSRRRPPAT